MLNVARTFFTALPLILALVAASNLVEWLCWGTPRFKRADVGAVVFLASLASLVLAVTTN